MQAHRVRLRTHQNCIVGRDLVEWLTRTDKAMKRFAFQIVLDLKHYFELYVLCSVCFLFFAVFFPLLPFFYFSELKEKEKEKCFRVSRTQRSGGHG